MSIVVDVLGLIAIGILCRCVVFVGIRVLGEELVLYFYLGLWILCWVFRICELVCFGNVFGA